MNKPPMEHGSSKYDYGTGKVSRGERPGRKEPMPMKDGQMPMQRKVVPGDAHASMRARGKSC